MITEQDDYRLRVDLQDFEGGTAYAEYSIFSVGTPVLKYRLTLGGYEADSTAGEECVKVIIIGGRLEQIWSSFCINMTLHFS